MLLADGDDDDKKRKGSSGGWKSWWGWGIINTFMLPSCCLPDIIIIFSVFVLYFIKYYSTLCDYILCINIKCMEVGDGVYKIYVYVIHKCVVSVAIILGCLFSFNKYFHVTHALLYAALLFPTIMMSKHIEKY